jgi:hypothetical protein
VAARASQDSFWIKIGAAIAERCLSNTPGFLSFPGDEESIAAARSVHAARGKSSCVGAAWLCPFLLAGRRPFLNPSVFGHSEVIDDAALSFLPGRASSRRRCFLSWAVAAALSKRSP